MRTFRSVVAVSALAAVIGCISSEPPPATTPAANSVPLNVIPKSAIDVLFLVDSSNSMESMQGYLKQNFFEFFRPFDDLAARGTYTDFHIGVISADLGSGSTGAPGCTPSGPMLGGDQGHLIALGRKAAQGCLSPERVPYIEFAYGPNGASISNLPKGQGLADTFTCMASLGAQGCGFEQQLESVYAALHDQSFHNAGFLREEAALAIVFLTNEDDASAVETTDIFDKNKVAMYGYEDSYSRQTRFAVQCGNPSAFPPYSDSNGPLKDCVPAPNLPEGAGPGRQFDVRRYIDFFTLPKAKGGVKADPADVILYAIDAPETPFQVILSNPGTPAGEPFTQCAMLNESSNPPCVPVLQHSCVNQLNPALFGDPAVRLNTVVRAAANHQIWSICDDNYQGAMHQFALLTAQTLLGAACLPQAVIGKSAAEVDCSVSDVLDDVDHETGTVIPRCADGVATPCWRLEAKPACEGRAAGSWGLTIDRGGKSAPPMTHPKASCTPRAP